MFLKNKVEDALGKKVCISDTMADKINLWKDCYLGCAPWLDSNVKSLNLSSAICSEFARQVTLELSSSVLGSRRAEVIDKCYQKFLKSIRSYVEYACALGGIVFKPYVSDGKLEIECIGADKFFPTGFLSDGDVSSAAFCEVKNKDKKTYLRIEHHNLTKDGCEITNRAFSVGSIYGTLSEIPLEHIDEWKELSPYTLLEGVKKPLFSYFKIPFANNIDLLSPLGVSVFSRATDVICEADKQYSRLLWEFEGGELAVDASIDAVKTIDGDSKMPSHAKRLFRAIDIDNGESDLYSVFSPALRDASLINGLDQILVRIEDLVGLARGVFSNMDGNVRTATELNILRQRTFSSVTDIQKALSCSLTSLVDAMDILCDVCKIAPSGNLSINFDFDDSTVVDRQTEFTERQMLLEQGILEKWEMRMWYLGEAEDVAKAAVEAISKKESDCI